MSTTVKLRSLTIVIIITSLKWELQLILYSRYFIHHTFIYILDILDVLYERMNIQFSPLIR